MTWHRSKWRVLISTVAVAALTLGACGDDGGEPGADESNGGGPAADDSAKFDGSWSGSTSTAGTIRFTVSEGAITSYKIETGEGVYGPACGEVSASNQVPDTEIRIVEGGFSWGGPGDGYPVSGSFDSETSASGTAEFSPGLVNGELPEGCQPNSATWEAEKTSDS